RDPRIRFLACADETAWIACAVEVIAGAIVRALDRGDRARLLLSGGSTPLPVLRALAQAALEWPRIDIGLVDERDVAAGDDDSNAQLVRESLLLPLAAEGHAVRFHPLRERAPSAADAVALANADPCVDPAGAVVVLGMGEDGHTASLFPGARDLA